MITDIFICTCGWNGTDLIHSFNPGFPDLDDEYESLQCPRCGKGENIRQIDLRIIKPLNWVEDEDESFYAETPFCSYSVGKFGINYEYRWIFNDFRYEQEKEVFGCDSIETGKEYAFRHWCDLLKPVINVPK